MQNFRFYLYLLAFLPILLQAQRPQLIIPTGHAEKITACSFSEDEQYLVSTDESGRIILWEIGSLKELQHFSSAIELTGLAISPDNRLIAGSSRDCTIEVWDISSGQPIWKNKVQFTRIVGLSFSADGRLLLSQTDNRHFQIWETSSGRQLQEWQASCATFQQNPKQLITGSEKLYLMDPYSGDKQLLYQGEDTVRQARFRRDTELTLLTDTEALAYDIRNKKVIRQFPIVLNDENGEARSAWKAWITIDGAQVFQFFQLPASNTLRQWDIESGRLLREQKFMDDDPVDGPYAQTYASPGGSLLVSTYLDNSIGPMGELWFTNANTGQQQPHLMASGTYLQAGLSPQGKQLYLGSNNYMEPAPGLAEIWQLDGVKLLFKEAEHERSHFQFTRHENIGFWESAYDDGALAWRNHVTGDTLWRINTDSNDSWGNHQNIACDLDDSGNRLVAGLPGDNLFLWQANTAAPPYWSARVEGQKIDWVQFLGQPGRLVSYANGRLQGWEIPKLQPVIDTPLPGKGPAACWANPSGERVIAARQTSGWQNPEISLFEWNTQNGELELLRTIPIDSLTASNRIRSLEITPNGKYLIAQSSYGMLDYLGGSMGKTGYSASIWDIDSGRWMAGFPGLQNPLIGLSPDGRYAFLLQSHAVEIVDIARDTLALTFIPYGKADWAVVAPSGLFDASTGAMEQMYFTLGLETLELEQLKERYYEPGLMQKLLGFSDEPIRSVEGLDTIALFPIVSLQLDTQSHQLQIGLTPRNGALGKVSVFVNGKEIIEDANPPQGFEKKRSTSLNVNLAPYRRYFLQDSLNTISVRAFNAAGWLKSPAQTVAYRPSFARAKGEPGGGALAFAFQATRDPALYAILIGTANYAGEKLDLKYPDKDAKAMASAIQQAGGQLFGPDSMVVRLFTTDTTSLEMHPSKDNIRKAFETIKARAKAEDILLVYLSGHGVTYGDAEQAQFYYLTQDISSEDLSDEGVRTTRAISSAELTKWINDIPAQKQVMILDACNSGKVVETLETGTKSLNSTQVRALDRMKDRTGMFVLAGSAADKVSYEASQYGQGLLTYSILQAMSGFKLRNGKYVDISLLFEYARDEVPKMAESIGGIQTPTMLTPGSGSIDIGIFNEQVHIPLSPKKPVFVRNYFQEETAFDDVLNIGELLESQLQEITAKGTQASLIYVDIPKYKDAYSIKGLYGLAEGRVSLQAKLFKGRTPLGDIQAKGQAGQLQELVDEVLKQAFGILQNE